MERKKYHDEEQKSPELIELARVVELTRAEMRAEQYKKMTEKEHSLIVMTLFRDTMKHIEDTIGFRLLQTEKIELLNLARLLIQREQENKGNKSPGTMVLANVFFRSYYNESFENITKNRSNEARQKALKRNPEAGTYTIKHELGPDEQLLQRQAHLEDHRKDWL